MVWLYIVGTIVVLLGASVFFGAPYVPSRRRDIQNVFNKLRPITKGDVVFDAGSGDGVVLREVSRRGGTAIGAEINPIFWYISKVISRGYKNVSVSLGNMWVDPFPDDITLLYVFAVSRDGKKLLAKINKERERIGRPFEVLCYGSPLPGITPKREFEAYHLYDF